MLRYKLEELDKESAEEEDLNSVRRAKDIRLTKSNNIPNMEKDVK